MKLYSYWRSTAAYRVRIALNLKGIDYETIPVDLVKEGGQQHAPDYVAKNPAHLVPSLQLPDGTVLTQSLAIIDYLDALVPEPALLETDPVKRAKELAIAHTIAMDIHPVNNLRVVQHLSAEFRADVDAKAEWMRYWMKIGFDALYALLEPNKPFVAGEKPGLADICIVAQMYNAHRWGLDLAPYARLLEIEADCLALKPFADARPEAQPDAA